MIIEKGMKKLSDHFFLAIPVPEHVAVVLQRTADSLKPYVSYKRWTDPQDFHITLFFFGAINDEKRLKMIQSVRETAQQTAPFRVTLSGIDGFGDKQQPRVLFASLDHSQELTALRERIRNVLADIGFDLETRAFHPHITIAKRWDQGAFQHSLPKGDYTRDSQSWEVSHVALFTVRPGQKPQYQSVADFPFQKE
ncbi:MAG: 2,3-cyclic phosphodiesterase [Sporolactobacillus laevolacticus]|jgi:2'-5' RNA ligase|nr:2,3-cyclic phosphodiesterase [Sporolactobacillus laevolacticus]